MQRKHNLPLPSIQKNRLFFFPYHDVVSSTLDVFFYNGFNRLVIGIERDGYGVEFFALAPVFFYVFVREVLGFLLKFYFIEDLFDLIRYFIGKLLLGFGLREIDWQLFNKSPTIRIKSVPENSAYLLEVKFQNTQIQKS